MGNTVSVPEIRRANAQVFLQSLRDKYNVELDFDRSGAEWLDQFIQSRAETLEERTIAGLSDLTGCFLGECIIREYGGRWLDADQDGLVGLADGDIIDPFWITESCLRFRAAYTVASLFGAVPEMARIRRGGLYAAPGEDGLFEIYKVLATDHVAVHLRKYANRFEAPPDRLDPASLDLGIDLHALQNAHEDDLPFDLAIGHFPLAYEGFWEIQPVLIQQDSVSDEELEGYRIWLQR